MIPPKLLKRFKSFAHRLSLNQINIPFNDMLWSGSSGSERLAEISENLLNLGLDIPFADNVSLRIDCILVTDIDGFHRSANANHLRKRWVFMQKLGIEILDESVC